MAHAPTPPTASIGSLGLDGGRGGGTRSTSRAGRSRQRSAPPSLFADPFSHLSKQVEPGARVGWGCWWVGGGWRLEGERVGRRNYARYGIEPRAFNARFRGKQLLTRVLPGRGLVAKVAARNQSSGSAARYALILAFA